MEQVQNYVYNNYKQTLRINNDALEILNWKPKDRLRKYINKLR